MNCGFLIECGVHQMDAGGGKLNEAVGVPANLRNFGLLARTPS